MSNFEFEAVANVGPSVSQPVTVDPLMTADTHSQIEKKKILDTCSSIIAQVQAPGVPESTVF